MPRPFKVPSEKDMPGQSAPDAAMPRARRTTMGLFRSDPQMRARLTGLHLFVDICLSGVTFNYVVAKWRDHGVGAYEMTRLAWAFIRSKIPEAVALRAALGIEMPKVKKNGPAKGSRLEDLRTLVGKRWTLPKDATGPAVAYMLENEAPSEAIVAEGLWRPRWPNWAPAFMVQLAEYPNVAHAASYAGVNWATARYHIDHTPGFRSAFEESEEFAIRAAEQELHHRGIHGFPEETWENGKLTKVVVKVESENLKWLLARKRPDEFGQRQEKRGNLGENELDKKLEVMLLHVYGPEAAKLRGLPAPQTVVDVTPGE